MKTVLVTGASGAFGRAVTTHLRENNNYRVIETSRNLDNKDAYKLDIRNSDQLSIAINEIKPDMILHLAATFVNDFEEAYAVNVDATRNLLEVIREQGGRARTVLVGSAAEYGIVHPEDNPVREDRILNPVSIYGLTKAWQTQLAALYASQGVDVVVARVFNLEGPGLSERLFIGRLEKQIAEIKKNRKSVIELGPLTATRDYISIDEAANQLLAIAEYGESGNVYNVASGTPVIMREILRRYLSIHNLDESIVHESESVTNRVGYDVPVIYADISKTLQLIRKRAESLDA